MNLDKNKEFYMKSDQKKDEIIEALHVVMDEFDENPIEDTRANDVMIEIMSARLEQYLNE
jgi:hypothetical protein